jgi:hypothetical protein
MVIASLNWTRLPNFHMAFCQYIVVIPLPTYIAKVGANFEARVEIWCYTVLNSQLCYETN